MKLSMLYKYYSNYNVMGNDVIYVNRQITMLLCTFVEEFIMCDFN